MPCCLHTGLHLGLEDRVLVLIVPLGAVLSNTGLHLGLEDRVLLLIVPLGAVLSSYGFTSWFGGQGIGSHCATWCCAVFIQGLHLGLEDRALVLIVPLGAVLSSYRVYILVWRTGHLF